MDGGGGFKFDFGWECWEYEGRKRRGRRKGKERKEKGKEKEMSCYGLSGGDVRDENR